MGATAPERSSVLGKNSAVFLQKIEASPAAAGLAPLVWFRSGVFDKVGSCEVYNYSTSSNFVGIDCSAHRLKGDEVILLQGEIDMAGGIW